MGCQWLSGWEQRWTMFSTASICARRARAIRRGSAVSGDIPSAAVDARRSPLAGWHEDDLVEIDVRGLFDYPEHLHCDVCGLQLLHPIIGFGGERGIPFEANLGELGALPHGSWGDDGDADAFGVRLVPQRLHERVHRKLGGAVDGSSLVGLEAGDGPCSDDGALPPAHHRRHHLADDPEGAVAVGVHHPAPVRWVRRRDRVLTESAPCVCNEDVDLVHQLLLAQLAVDSFIAAVARDAADAHAKAAPLHLVLDLEQLLAPARHEDEVDALGGERTRSGLAYA
mmetsp:Transcript_48377/g.112046  ORF Transcript_48377/g.112046 Transcript_48377/m.112046 type:complete len:283 (+) Transcript_48377:379-1227(+)